MKFKYEPPRIKTSDLQTEVSFFELKKIDSPMPSKNREKTLLYKCWAKIENVWSIDIEIAKANGTLSDVTISIRETHGEYIPTTKHFVEIHAEEYKDIQFDIKEAFPDLQTRSFIKIVAEVRS